MTSFWSGSAPTSRAHSSAAEKNSASAGGTTALPEASGCCLRSDARSSRSFSQRARMKRQEPIWCSRSCIRTVARIRPPSPPRSPRPTAHVPLDCTVAESPRNHETSIVDGGDPPRPERGAARPTRPDVRCGPRRFRLSPACTGDQAPDGPAARNAKEAACDTPLVHDRRCTGPGDHRPRPAALGRYDMSAAAIRPGCIPCWSAPMTRRTSSTTRCRSC